MFSEIGTIGTFRTLRKRVKTIFMGRSGRRSFSPRVSPSRDPFFLAPITSKRLLRRLVFALKLEKLLVNDKITALHCVKQICLPSIISNITNHTNEIWKTFRIISFQKAQLPSISIFCNTVHSKFLSFCICLVVYTLFSCFEQIFLFHLNRWWFPLPKFREISRHSSFKRNIRR